MGAPLKRCNSYNYYPLCLKNASQVLFVAMDEVAFDYMDDMAPGCVALIPGRDSVRFFFNFFFFVPRVCCLGHVLRWVPPGTYPTVRECGVSHSGTWDASVRFLALVLVRSGKVGRQNTEQDVFFSGRSGFECLPKIMLFEF